MADYTGYQRAFDRAGIPVTFESGWKNRGHGDIPANKIKFIVLHHTAGSLNDQGQINVVRDGTNGLRGPLSQIVLKHGDGLPHVIAAGVSWHAFGEISFRGVPAGSGNYYSLGIEAVSTGLRDDWSKAQRENYPKVVAALLVDLGLDEKAWIFHRDFQPRSKIDPAFWTAKQMQDGVSYWYHKIKNGSVAPKKTAIEDLADKLKLGTPVTPERTCPDGVGKNRVYNDGKTIVYWTPQTPAAAVGGENLKKYSQVGYEKSVLGYPITNEVKIRDNGTYQRFQKGNIYYTPKYGSKLVYGSIFNRWGELDYEKGPLGYPITDELTASDGKGHYNEFETGTIYWSAKTGAHEVYGLIRDAFKNAGGLEKVGYPTTGEREVPTKTGKYNHFENGSIYWKKGQKKAIFVPKWVVDVWADLGWEVGILGYPINNVETIDGIEQQGFEAGTIGFNKEKNQTLLRVDGKWADYKKAPLPEAPAKPKRTEAKVGDLFVDYSAGVPAAKDVKSKGFAGAMRYISPARDAWMKGKPMSKKELDDYKANGMQVGFIWQNLKNDWTAGYVGGVADAKAAQKKMEELGHPDAVIYCAIDNNLAQNTKDALSVWNKTAAEYVKGFQSVLGRERVGVYANYFVISWAIEDKLGTYYWQHNWTNTRSDNGQLERRVHPEAHIHQYEIDTNGVLPFAIDRNRVLKPYFGQV